MTVRLHVISFINLYHSFKAPLPEERYMISYHVFRDFDKSQDIGTVSKYFASFLNEFIFYLCGWQTLWIIENPLGSPSMMV